ncbi:MAG TPA: penicillin acylase family protein [Leptospiraceae bacterium]|nr:penicillin acylase family protein [Leptospiraceae bacterium]HMX35432.1 penicillin acylase family protein [Leptospiraceae bacterium]HMY30570.1 penicillin acylase family protein [Leptospiraceae bacterium]HMZ65501.1 penicillin acylase family protein [Leptospiraceae bacterium]HNA09754.1 penicillin acylase family protein [Leptospiraceae bacterium]
MNTNVKITRTNSGTPKIKANTIEECLYGLGYVHAVDRGMQMVFMKILGQGRLSELLDSSDHSLEIDKFFRRMNWYGRTKKPLAEVDKEKKQWLKSYCDGVNDGFAESFPFEFKLLGVPKEAWTIEDSILISRMIGYLTLAQSQAEIERLFIEMVQAGLSENHLKELFPNILDGAKFDSIKKIKLEDRVVPSSLWEMGAPKMMASNNWVIGGKKTKSGKPILANDPHLEINRLPSVWGEVILSTSDWYAIGGSMPGVPGILTGRTNHLSWGVTYAFIDAYDSWMEDCKEGKYLKEGKYTPFIIRKESIKRKKKKTEEVIFYENEHGTLSGDPFKEGIYLTSQWTGMDSGGITVNSILSLLTIQKTKEAMSAVSQVETAWNFVFADAEGNIGYQMSGKVPKRKKGLSGFVPFCGWDKKEDWNGFESPSDLPKAYNPKEGFFTTANNDLNSYGKIQPINMGMGSYRADRITDIIRKAENFTVADVCKMHYDVYSKEAEIFMKILSPILPDTKQGHILKNWNFEYDIESEGAYLFEVFYKALFVEVFGKMNLGKSLVEHLQNETGVFIDFYDKFVRILLSEKSIWFGSESREQIFKRVAEVSLNTEIKKWGEVQKIKFTHILFGGKLPKFLGFDHGPISLPGGRATISQGQIYQAAGRTTSFAASIRIVSDMATDEVVSNMPGGPSDRRFSKWYVTDLKNWISGKYKTLSANSSDIKF